MKERPDTCSTCVSICVFEVAIRETEAPQVHALLDKMGTENHIFQLISEATDCRKQLLLMVSITLLRITH